MNKIILQTMIENGYSTWQIADETGKGQTTIRYWLNKYNLTTVVDKKCKCKFCGEVDQTKFHNHGNGRLSKSKCKSCHNKYTIDRFRKSKIQAVEYKGGKCEKCGYNKCVGALQFHHINPKLKDPNWRLMRNWVFEKIKSEINKCILLCANCHAEEHYNN